jgi:hypothetical protein
MALPPKIRAKLTRPAMEDQIMNPPRPLVREQSEQEFAAALDQLQATFDDGDGLLGESLFDAAPEVATTDNDAPESPHPTQAIHRSVRR